MDTRMLYQCWINVELRRRQCVEKMLDLQIGSTSKRRHCRPYRRRRINAF